MNELWVSLLLFRASPVRRSFGNYSHMVCVLFDIVLIPRRFVIICKRQIAFPLRVDDVTDIVYHNDHHAKWQREDKTVGEKTHPTENSPASSVKQILRNVFDQILNIAPILILLSLLMHPASGSRLFVFSHNFTNYSSLCDRIKTPRYPHRRHLLHNPLSMWSVVKPIPGPG